MRPDSSFTVSLNQHNNNINFRDSVVNPALLLLVYPFLAVCAILFLWVSWRCFRCPRTKERKVFAFFHPYCGGGGGGERVLWKIIQSLQQSDSGVHIVIFTVDPPDTQETKLRKDAERRFQVNIPHPVQLVSLEDCQEMLRPRPFLSLVMESWGTMQLAHRALRRYQEQFQEQPIDVYWDTTGCAFTFFVARWMCPSAYLLAYVHYPTISKDMMAWEWSRKGRPFHKTFAKIVYYWGFAVLYSFAGSMADLVMVNSTWTYNHIKGLWGILLPKRRIQILYPPCSVPSDAKTLETFSLSDQRERVILSVGQFRPEKDHALQIDSMAKLFEKYPQHKQENVKLVLIGSCRNELDQQRLDTLRKQVERIQLSEYVTFSINPSNEEMQSTMKSALIGIHTMRQEHFGIAIVEMMASGLIVVAHGSGGPKADIIQHRISGYLATTLDEYAEALHEALTLPTQEARILREQANASASRFSDRIFDEALPAILSSLS